MKNNPARPSMMAKNRGSKKSRDEFEEFGPGKKELRLCGLCNAVYYNKSWHHNLQSYKHKEKQHNMTVTHCPACTMWQNGQWEGEVRLNGVPKEKLEEISHNLLHFADDAYRKDPMHRIFDLTFSSGELRVLTSENQLAQKLGKHLAKSFKGNIIAPKIKEPKGDDAVVVHLSWQ